MVIKNKTKSKNFIRKIKEIKEMMKDTLKNLKDQNKEVKQQKQKIELKLLDKIQNEYIVKNYKQK